jgi:predicted Zn-dependent protease with MMP-like domain
MDARSKPGLKDPFVEAIDDALSSLPADLRAAMSNVEIVVEDEPPGGRPLLGLYRGVPLPRRSSTYSEVAMTVEDNRSGPAHCGRIDRGGGIDG